MPVDETVGQAQVAAARRPVALVMLAVLLVAAVVSAAGYVRYAEYLSEINLFFAETAIVYQVLAVLYGALAGIALLGGVVLVVRPRLGTRLLLVFLTLTVPGQALILCGTVIEDGDLLVGGDRFIGDPTLALAAVQLTAMAAAVLATCAALAALIRGR